MRIIAVLGNRRDFIIWALQQNPVKSSSESAHGEHFRAYRACWSWHLNGLAINEIVVLKSGDFRLIENLTLALGAPNLG